MTQENKDLCKTCIHFWTDFPMPLEQVVPHCELVDNWYGYRDMGDIVGYPCIKCPFNCYIDNNHYKDKDKN